VPPLAREAALLGAAIRALRVDGDAAAALSRLARYEAEHPDGALAAEALRVRVEALMQLGRRAEALVVLDESSVPTDEGGAELRLVRADLRLAAGRARAALSDYEGIDPGDRSDALVARSLFGQARCWHALGDAARTLAALDRYLAAFPLGRDAPAARALRDETLRQNAAAAP
jgi:hypothetical protein